MSNIIQKPCPSELKYKVCSRRYDAYHKSMYCHFNQFPIKMIRVSDGSVKCVCKYSVQKGARKKLCWEKDSESHNKTFVHDH
jgi:hypothetical protein